MVRGDARQSRAHPLEERPGGLGAQVADEQPRLGSSARIRHQDARERIHQHVGPGLAEELPGQGDVPLVEVMDIREIRDVRRAVRGACRDHRGNAAFQRVAERGQRSGHGDGASTRPARGPGVCSNTATGTKRTQTSPPGS